MPACFWSSPTASETTLTVAENTPLNAWPVNKAVVYSMGNIPARPDRLHWRIAWLLLRISIIHKVSAKNWFCQWSVTTLVKTAVMMKNNIMQTIEPRSRSLCGILPKITTFRTRNRNAGSWVNKTWSGENSSCKGVLDSCSQLRSLDDETLRNLYCQ